MMNLEQKNSTNRSLIVEIGGGLTRAAVVEIDKIKPVIIANWSFSLPFAQDLFQNNSLFSVDMIDNGTAILHALKIIGHNYGATKFTGFLTGTLLKASNVKVAIEQWNELGFDLQVISCQADGEIGFNTLCALKSDYDRDSIVVIDSGASSCRISTLIENKIVVYDGMSGRIEAVKMFVEVIKKQPYVNNCELNPVGEKNFNRLIEILKSKIELPTKLKRKFTQQRAKVFCLGTIFQTASKYLQQNPFTVNDLQNKIIHESLYNKDGVYLSSMHDHPCVSNSIVIGMAQIIALMQALGVREVESVLSDSGNILGFVSQQQLRYSSSSK